MISGNDQIQQGREVNYTADSPMIKHNSSICSRGVFSLKTQRSTQGVLRRRTSSPYPMSQVNPLIMLQIPLPSGGGSPSAHGWSAKAFLRKGGHDGFRTETQKEGTECKKGKGVRMRSTCIKYEYQRSCHVQRRLNQLCVTPKVRTETISRCVGDTHSNSI